MNEALLDQVKAIMQNPVSQWVEEEWRIIDKGNRTFGRDKMQAMLDEAGTEGK